MFLALLLSVVAQGGATANDPGPVPWVVVEDPQHERYDCLINPQLVAFPDGVLVACYEHSGHYGSPLGMHFARSEDRGRTWQSIAVVKAATEACLFVHADSLWLLGRDEQEVSKGAIAIRCSKDRGATWTTPTNATDGLLRGPGLGSTIAAPACSHDGRVWRAFTNFVVTGVKAHHSVLVASADLGSDLLTATNWRWSSEFPLSFQPLAFSTMVSVEGEKDLVLMVSGPDDKASSAKVSTDGWRLVSPRFDDQIAMPESADGGRVIRDVRSDRSFVLASQEIAPATPSEHMRQTNVLSLLESDFLHAWKSAGDLLHDPGAKRYRFHWSDALADGEDLLVLLSVILVGDKDTKRPWERKIVFLRVPKFRERTESSPPLWGPPVPR